jgi:hypothetical protein
LTDNTCNFTYYSDGLPVDHVIVEGSNPYSLRFADGGAFCERTLTPTNDFQGFNFRVDLTIADQPDQLITASGTNISAVEGAPFSGTVATFTDPDLNSTAAEYAASVDWGDGSPSSTGAIGGPAGGPFTVTGSHTYTEEGSRAVAVTITDIDTTSNTATANSTATVADAALTAIGLNLISGPAYDGPVATFTDANSFSTGADFTATIDWGDGSAATSGTVTGGGPYTVNGSHTYGSLGFFTIKVHIVDDGGSTADATSTVLIFGTAAGGNFVIGDGNSAIGERVTFWSAQWWKLNRLSGGAAPPAFKGFGFANSPSRLPACGTSWSTSPGNSPPPSGPLPAFVAVLVSSSISQSGSTISGNTPHIVIVKTDPGYAPDPGHAGTGTVVAAVC